MLQEASRHSKQQVDPKKKVSSIADNSNPIPPVYSQTSIPVPVAQNQAYIPVSAIQNRSSIPAIHQTSIPGLAIQNQTSIPGHIQNQASVSEPAIQNQNSISGPAVQSQTTSVPVAQIQSGSSQTSMLVPSSGTAFPTEIPDTPVSNISASNLNVSGSSNTASGPHLILSNSVPKASNAVPCNLITFQIAPSHAPVISPDQSADISTHSLIPTPVSSDSGVSVPIFNNSNLHSMPTASASFNAMTLPPVAQVSYVSETHGTSSSIVEPGRVRLAV